MLQFIKLILKIKKQTSKNQLEEPLTKAKRVDIFIVYLHVNTFLDYWKIRQIEKKKIIIAHFCVTFSNLLSRGSWFYP